MLRSVLYRLRSSASKLCTMWSPGLYSMRDSMRGSMRGSMRVSMLLCSILCSKLCDLRGSMRESGLRTVWGVLEFVRRDFTWNTTLTTVQSLLVVVMGAVMVGVVKGVLMMMLARLRAVRRSLMGQRSTDSIRDKFVSVLGVPGIPGIPGIPSTPCVSVGIVERRIDGFVVRLTDIVNFVNTEW